jgi:hypothetical protein
VRKPQWTVTGPEPPAWVELPSGASSALYRLVRRRHFTRPARDNFGNYPYVPMTEGRAERVDVSRSRVIPYSPAARR